MLMNQTGVISLGCCFLLHGHCRNCQSHSQCSVYGPNEDWQKHSLGLHCGLADDGEDCWQSVVVAQCAAGVHSSQRLSLGLGSVHQASFGSIYLKHSYQNWRTALWTILTDVSSHKLSSGFVHLTEFWILSFFFWYQRNVRINSNQSIITAIKKKKKKRRFFVSKTKCFHQQ